MIRKSLFTLLLAFGVAAWAAAQTESRQSASPTSSQFRIQVTEPMEGATITGTTINIVLAGPRVPSGTAVSEEKRRDELTPIYQIWVDGKDYGNLPSEQNVFTASNLSYGPHTVVIVAKNTAGELIDRKELKFTTVEATTETRTEATSSTERMRMAPAPPPAPPAPAPEPPPAPAPERETTYAAESETLPATATGYPLAALAGLGLLGAGLLLRRRA